MANKVWWSRTSLTGGGAGALDGIDGADLTGGDYAHVDVGNILYVYTLNAASADSELSPWRIAPDANAGTKMWELIHKYEADWKWVPTANFTAAPASTSTITMGVNMTAEILPGMSLAYTIGGVVYYGIVSAIVANLLTVAGAPLGGNVTTLQYDGGEITNVRIVIPDTYEDASNTTLIVTDLDSYMKWDKPKSYAVKFSVYSDTHDSGTHGQASVRINGTELCTTAGGLTIAADKTVYSTVVDIDTAAYDVNYGEAIDVTCVKNGAGDATDLTVEIVFVTP